MKVNLVFVVGVMAAMTFMMGCYVFFNMVEDFQNQPGGLGEWPTKATILGAVALLVIPVFTGFISVGMLLLYAVNRIDAIEKLCKALKRSIPSEKPESSMPRLG